MGITNIYHIYRLKSTFINSYYIIKSFLGHTGEYSGVIGDSVHKGNFRQTQCIIGILGIKYDLIICKASITLSDVLSLWFKIILLEVKLMCDNISFIYGDISKNIKNKVDILILITIIQQHQYHQSLKIANFIYEAIIETMAL